MVRLVLGAAALMISANALADAPVAQQPLNLTCVGGGTANKHAYVTGQSDMHVSGMVGTTMVSGNGSGTTTMNIPRQQGFADQVDLRLFNGNDQIRMPRTMLPGLHGGDHGWFRLKGVKADARSITGSVYVNFINHPKVYIDRATGTISISGKAGDYSGQCEPIQGDAPAKF
jgi:uncharacterized Zn-finger protein